MPYDEAQAAQAAALARQAAEVAAKLKPGTWEAVQSLALAAIALQVTAQTPDR